MLNVTVSPAELANRLTMAGNEVKAVEMIGANWENVVIGQITGHQSASQCRPFEIGDCQIPGKEKQTVVCGAPNLTVGDKIVFASVGAELKDGHTGQTMRLKPAKIRGVESKGMICSEMELGISQNHEGILVLPPDAPLGMPLTEYLGIRLLTWMSLLTVRTVLSVIGIARETAALTGQKVHIPDVKYAETDIAD